MRKVFLEKLPVKQYGKKNVIDWENTISMEIEFIYNDINGKLKILKYIKRKKHSKIKVQYNKNVCEMEIENLKQCKLGGIIKGYTPDFKFEIGQRIVDEKRDITITYQKKQKDKNGNELRWYQYKCNICNFTSGEHYKKGEYKKEYWVVESALLNGTGCVCCSRDIVIKGINDLATTNSWMFKFIKCKEDMYKYSQGMDIVIPVICPHCNTEKQINIRNLYKRHSISCSCSDKTSYPEKIMFSILNQLKIKFQTQLTKTTFKWCNSYKYDFYFELNDESYIVETHGEQHYKENGNWKMSLKEVQENDKLKKELALKNGIKSENYIVINCEKSELEWIKNSIIKSNLERLFDLDLINWNKCEEFALNNRVKEACDLWNKKESYETTVDIANKMSLTNTTIRGYLKKGMKFGWCYYCGKDEMIKNAIRNNPQVKKSA